MEIQPLPPGTYNLKPLWARSPKKFKGAHEVTIALRFQEWESAGRELSLVKFTSEYLSKLPADLPAAAIVEIVQWVGAAWQKRYVDRSEVVAGAILA